MPLRCVAADKEEFAFEHDEDSWASLRKRNLKEKFLSFPCCDSAVILKTSSLGTRYFAHAARGECTSGPETQEHLRAKSIICQALKEAGWFSSPEERFQDQDGDCIVDVLGSRTKESRAKIAFEVQWSPQTDEVTQQRTARYTALGLRSLWFFRQPNIPNRLDTPSVRIIPNGDSFDVVLPKDRLLYGYVTRNDLYDIENWRNCGPLDAFVKGVVEGRFRFGIAQAFDIGITAYALPRSRCNRCNAQTRAIRGVQLDFGPLNADYPRSFMDVEDLGEVDTAFSRSVIQWLNESFRKETGYKIAPVRSRTTGKRYFANTCLKCNAFFGSFFLHTNPSETKPLGTATMSVNPIDLRAMKVPRDRWCFVDGYSADADSNTDHNKHWILPSVAIAKLAGLPLTP